MEFVFDNDRPIYIQIVEYLRIEIISGNFKMGEKISSVRDLALLTKVNPNTMQKALFELEREGLIYTERTNGKYVTSDEKLIEKVKLEIIDEKVNNFLKDMKKIGITNEEIKKYFERNEKR